MAAHAQATSPSKRSGLGRVFTLMTGIICFGLLGYLLVQIVYQFVVPPPAHRLILVQDIPLPSAIPSPAEETLLASGDDPKPWLLAWHKISTILTFKPLIRTYTFCLLRIVGRILIC